MLMNEQMYSDLDNNKEVSESIKRRSDLKHIYFDFLNDFRDYLVDFVKISMHETIIAEVSVSTEPVALFKDISSGRFATFKNQGRIECYLTTGRNGGYRLDAGEVMDKVWVNKPVSVVTISGTTVLGIIQA